MIGAETRVSEFATALAIWANSQQRASDPHMYVAFESMKRTALACGMVADGRRTPDEAMRLLAGWATGQEEWRSA